MVVFLTLSARIARAIKNQITAIETTNRDLKNEIVERQRAENALRDSEEALRKAKSELEIRVEERTFELKKANERLEGEVAERKRAEEKLRRRSQELATALKTTRKARKLAEKERDKSRKMLAEVSESKHRLEVLISDATAREKRMVELKNEVNELSGILGREPKYEAPFQVDEFLSTGHNPAIGQKEGTSSSRQGQQDHPWQESPGIS